MSISFIRTERTYLWVRIPQWLAVSRAVDELGPIGNDLALFVLADDGRLGGDVDLCRESVAGVDQMCNGAARGGRVPVVVGEVRSRNGEEFVFLDLVGEVGV